MRVLASSLLLTAALSTPALADTKPTPSFATMDNTADGSKVQADIAVSTIKDAKGELARTSLLGQYVLPSGIGGYVGIAGSAQLFGEDSAFDFESLGSLQGGALYQRSLTDEIAIALRLGVIAPTGGEGVGNLGYLASTAFSRPADLATGVSDTTWLRLGVSPTVNDGLLFLRADIGLDIPVLETEGVDMLGHLNLGAGIALDKLSLAAELQNLATFQEAADERFMHSAALSASYHAGVVTPFAAVSTPLDDGPRGDVLTVLAGVRANL
jgi:hypothetical protein